MAEIKSTLDLIMEKTKGLTLSPEEKEKIHREEWLKKAKGWIQKFLDDRTDLGKVKDELFSREKPLEWKKILKQRINQGSGPGRGKRKTISVNHRTPGNAPRTLFKDIEGIQSKSGAEKRFV